MMILAMKRLHSWLFKTSLNFSEKARGNGAVDDPVIGRQRRGHQRFDREHAVVGNDPRRDASDGQYGALRRVDDRDETIDAEHAEIGNRKRSAFVIERQEVFVLRLVGQLAALLCSSALTQLGRVAEYPHDPTLFQS